MDEGFIDVTEYVRQGLILLIASWAFYSVVNWVRGRGKNNSK